MPREKSYDHLQKTFDWEIVKLLTSILNLNDSAVTTPLRSNFWDSNSNENWNLAQLANGRAELSSASIIFTNDIPTSSEYSFAIDTFRPQLYFRAKSLREERNIYRVPFSTEVWISFAVVVALLTIVLTFVLSREAELPHKISYDVYARIIDVQEDRDEDWVEDLPNNMEETLHQRERWEVGEILLVCLGALCQQGSARDPSTHAARILLLVLFLMSALFNTIYSASVIGFISHWPSTERELNFNFRNFSAEKILIHDTNDMENYLKLGLQKVKKVGFREGFSRALAGEALFVGDRDASLTFFHQHNFESNLKCKLGRASLGVEYQRVLGVKKNSAYKEKINYNILRIKEFGLLKRIKTNIFNTKPPCSQLERSSTTTFVTFNKNDIWPALRILIIGLALSILILFGEKFICLKTVHGILISMFEMSQTLIKKIQKTLVKNFLPSKSILTCSRQTK